jgi:hypothetical protein
MRKAKLISDFFRYIVLGFLLANMIWHGITGHSYIKSKFLFFGTIVAGLIYLVFYISYLTQAKNYKELKHFFLTLIITAAVICLLIFLA